MRVLENATARGLEETIANPVTRTTTGQPCPGALSSSLREFVDNLRGVTAHSAATGQHKQHGAHESK